MATRNLIKRGTVYHARVTVNGKERWKSTGTSDARLANARAKIIIERIKNQQWSELERVSVRGSKVATLAELVARYREVAAERRAVHERPSERTAWNYTMALLNVVRTGTGCASAETEPVTVLTRELAERYAVGVIREAGDDLVLRERYRRTAHSTLRQARSVLSSWALDKMQDLRLPDLRGFTKGLGEASGKRKYTYPPNDLGPRTIAAARALRTDRPDLYMAFLLCYDLGMRSGEAVAARWDWIEDRGGRKEMAIIRRPYFKPKNKTDRRVPIAATVFEHMTAGRREADEWILPGGSETARKNLIARELAAWMRAFGWDDKTYSKCAHELRKLIVSEWYTRYGVEVAAKWSGDTIKTVWDYYGDLTRNPDPIEI